jgi:hypothetical protein
MTARHLAKRAPSRDIRSAFAQAVEAFGDGFAGHNASGFAPGIHLDAGNGARLLRSA